MLRRILCGFVDHVKDTESKDAFAQPGMSRCVRCRGFYPLKGPLGLPHALLLQRLGWSHEEIDRLSFDPLYGDTVFRVLREVKELCDGEGQARIQRYEDAYISGFSAALRSVQYQRRGLVARLMEWMIRRPQTAG